MFDPVQLWALNGNTTPQTPNHRTTKPPSRRKLNCNGLDLNREASQKEIPTLWLVGYVVFRVNLNLVLFSVGEKTEN